MKLKYQFVVSTIDGNPVAVAVGQDNGRFNGMIRLNDSGEMIFKTLCDGDISQEELLRRFAAQYGVTEELARPSVLAFLDQLRQNGLLDE